MSVLSATHCNVLSNLGSAWVYFPIFHYSLHKFQLGIYYITRQNSHTVTLFGHFMHQSIYSITPFLAALRQLLVTQFSFSKGMCFA